MDSTRCRPSHQAGTSLRTPPRLSLVLLLLPGPPSGGLLISPPQLLQSGSPGPTRTITDAEEPSVSSQVWFGPKVSQRRKSELPDPLRLRLWRCGCRCLHQTLLTSHAASHRSEGLFNQQEAAAADAQRASAPNRSLSQLDGSVQTASMNTNEL